MVDFQYYVSFRYTEHPCLIEVYFHKIKQQISQKMINSTRLTKEMLENHSDPRLETPWGEDMTGLAC